MDRKWRTNRAAIHTVLSLPEFRQCIGPLRPSYSLATVTDLYAAYTVLHIESKRWELQWSEAGGFYYFVTQQTVELDGSNANAVAPEGDEDTPEVKLKSFRMQFAEIGVGECARVNLSSIRPAW